MANASRSAASRRSSPPDTSTAPTATGKRAGKATLLFMGFVLLSRVLGVVRDMVISHLFGQSQVTDVYTAAFRIPDILYLLVAGGALSTVFVPVFAEYWSEDRQEDAWKTFGSVMSIVAAAAFVLVIVTWLAAVPLARLLNPKFEPAAVLETARLSRILLPAQWCFFVGGLMMGTLNARQRFLIPALGPVIYNSGAIVSGLLFHKSLGIAALAYGAVGGAVIGNFLLPLWELRRADAQFYFSFDTSHPGVRKVGRLMLPALLGLSLSQLVFWLTPTFLKADGSISALRNAYNLTQAPIGIFAQASAIVLFPTISVLAAQKQWFDFRREISLGIRRILFLTIPASLLMAALAEPIITAFFLSDKFGSREVVRAADALRWYSLGTFAWSAQAVLARGFYAMQDTKTPVVITTSMVALFAALCFVLTAVFDTGYLGLAATTSFVATLNMLIFLHTLRKRVGGLDLEGIIAAVVKITLAAAIASGAAYVLDRFFLFIFRLEHPGRGVSLLILAIAGGLSLGLYGLFCVLLRVSEIRGVREMFKRSA